MKLTPALRVLSGVLVLHLGFGILLFVGFVLSR
jgi:hypothetical protein